MNTILNRRGLTIAAASALMLGTAFFGSSAANAATADPPPLPVVDCVSFTAGVNSVTAAGTVTMDPAYSDVQVNFGVTTPDGSFGGVQDLTASGPFSITVSNIPATTGAQLQIFGLGILDASETDVTRTGTCSHDASFVITGPPAPPTQGHVDPHKVQTGMETKTQAFQNQQLQNQQLQQMMPYGIALLVLAALGTTAVAARKRYAARK
jgi:hypothetical protein